MPMLLTRYSTDHPLEWYRAFLTEVVISNGSRFATLTALGEVAVGLGLTLGFLTPIASLFGALLVILYGLATFHVGPSQQGFHLVLLACMIAFFLARAGRFWGLDAPMRRRFSRWPG
jgi:thiosulfate dehydrogenase [quinone] large subunit